MGESPAPELRVLYEDDDLIAVEKPAGMHTAPLSSGESGTLLSLLLLRHPEMTRVPGIKPVEPGLLHRLDRDTSGIVVAALTASAFQGLRAEFQSGAVLKEYAAVCADIRPSRGAPGARDEVPLAPGARLSIRSRFAPSGPGRRMVRVVLPSEGSRSILGQATKETYSTEVRVVENRGRFLLVHARIVKGFRHQIRAHLAALGLPILGDPLYGIPAPEGAEQRMYLHSTRVELRHPVTGEPVSIDSPLPECFQVLSR